MSTVIPYGRHHLDEDDIQAVVEVLRHGFLTQGPEVARFEAAVADYVGARFAVAVANGTAALHLACLAADFGPGDEVYTTPNTFVASANCARYVGATPRFADIDAQTLNLDPDDLARRCRDGSSVRGIIPVHFAGLPCDMPRIRAVADEHGAVVIEDACHALGATYADGSRVGNCRDSAMTVFSFHPAKGVTSGEGGMITTNDEDLYRRLMSLRSHGISKDADGFMNPDEGMEGDEARSWYYEMQELGLNYRITDLQCALATSQLGKIEAFVARRREIVKAYDQAFGALPGVQITQAGGREHSSHHIYVLRIDFDRLGVSRHRFMRRLASKGVGSQVHYIPVPMQPYYRQMGHRADDYPQAQRYYTEALTLPLFYGLSDEQVEMVIDAVQSLLQA